MTDAGKALWPTIFALSKWGERYTTAEHRARIFSHVGCDTDVDDHGRCPACGLVPGPHDLVVRPGPGPVVTPRHDPVARALSRPHRMLTPVSTNTA